MRKVSAKSPMPQKLAKTEGLWLTHGLVNIQRSDALHHMERDRLS